MMETAIAFPPEWSCVSEDAVEGSASIRTLKGEDLPKRSTKGGQCPSLLGVPYNLIIVIITFITSFVKHHQWVVFTSAAANFHPMLGGKPLTYVTPISLIKQAAHSASPI